MLHKTNTAEEPLKIDDETKNDENDGKSGLGEEQKKDVAFGNAFGKENEDEDYENY